MTARALMFTVVVLLPLAVSPLGYLAASLLGFVGPACAFHALLLFALLSRAGSVTFLHVIGWKGKGSGRVVGQPGRFLLGAFAYELAIGLSALAGVYLGLYRLDRFPYALMLLLPWLAFEAGSLLLPPSDTFHRGRRVLSLPEAVRAAKGHRPKGDPGIPFGGVRLPSASDTVHFLIVGTTGSGKSVLLKRLMRHLLVQVTPGSDKRAVVFDPRGEMLELITTLGLPCPVRNLNPFAVDGVAWDIARDCTTPATALQIATALIPEERGSNNPFFVDASRHLLYGALLSLVLYGAKGWTLRDVLLVMRSRKKMEYYFSRHAETKDLLQYFAEERTWANIFATIQTKLAPFEPVAALWQGAHAQVSLGEFLRTESVIVLQTDEGLRRAIDPLFRVFIQRLGELVLSLPDSRTRRVWLFLDELRLAGRLELGPLLSMGRAKGASIAIAFQDLSGLKTVYGPDGASELLSLCSHKAVLRLEGEETSHWARRLVGDFERFESGSPPGDPGSEQLQKRELLLQSEFMSHPPTGPEHGLSGFFLSPYVGVWRAVLAWEDLVGGSAPGDTATRPRARRPDALQYLRPWTSEDLTRLGIEDQDLVEGDQSPPAPAPQQKKAHRRSRLKIVPSKRDG